MLVRLMEVLKKTQNLSLPHKGVVVDNNDTKKLGRVKVTISGILEGATANLPWAFPRRNYGLGGSTNESTFHVPEIGAELVILFSNGNIYFPEYVGTWNPTNVKSTLFDEGYPHTYGWHDSTQTHLRINKSSSFLDFLHTSGITITMDQAGNMTLTVPKDKTTQVLEDLFETIAQDRIITIGNDKTENISNNEAKTIGGNKTNTITGNETKNVTGNKVNTVTGNDTETITGQKLIKALKILLEDSGSSATVPVCNFRICPILGINHSTQTNILLPE